MTPMIHIHPFNPPLHPLASPTSHTRRRLPTTIKKQITKGGWWDHTTRLFLPYDLKLVLKLNYFVGMKVRRSLAHSAWTFAIWTRSSTAPHVCTKTYPPKFGVSETYSHLHLLYYTKAPASTSDLTWLHQQPGGARSGKPSMISLFFFLYLWARGYFYFIPFIFDENLLIDCDFRMRLMAGLLLRASVWCVWDAGCRS
jgi:hypothetical protein